MQEVVNWGFTQFNTKCNWIVFYLKRFKFVQQFQLKMKEVKSQMEDMLRRQLVMNWKISAMTAEVGPW